ncbi:MAG: hypothetical protein ICV73_20480, partial [Acetobacteraceae bacterium]|nr:hypothetical protein [Acetobacteraceae bacterium]
MPPMIPALPRLSIAAFAASLPLFAGCAWNAVPPGGQRVEEVASLTEKPGNPAVTADGRLIFAMHPLNRPAFKLMERRAEGGGAAVPFPVPERSRTAFDNPLGIRAAADGTLWTFDMGDHAGAAAHPATRPPRRVAGTCGGTRRRGRSCCRPRFCGPTPGRRTSPWT